MIASDMAIEMFFSTWGACAEAGPVTRIDAEASTARLTKRML
jgi:hypothetical protein